MNKVVLIGRLTKDIEIRYTQKEDAVGNFTLAVQRNYKNANGETESDFINCVCFKQIAKLIEQYTNKGDQLAIEGKIQTRNYEDKEGKKRTSTEVVVENIQFLGAKKKEENPYKDMSIKTEASQQFEIDDSMLPF